MNLLFGVGNEDNMDDGVGPYLAKNINLSGWKGVNCSVTPENFTSIAKKEKPGILLIADAAEMGIEPGDFRVIRRDRIDELAISTHYMPLSILMRYLSDSAGEIVFVGIQPKEHGEGQGLSKEVKAGAHRLLDYLQQGRLDKVKWL